MVYTNQKKQRLAVGFVILIASLVPAPSKAQEPSSSVLRDWQYYNNIGWQAYNRGNDARAAQAFREAIETLRPYHANYGQVLARSNVDYARVLCRQGRHDEAEPLVKWALSVREKSPGPKSKALCENLEMLAQIHRARKRHAEAETVLKRLSEIQLKALGEDHNDLIATYESLAEVYSAEGKLAEAEPAYRRALALREGNAAANLKLAETLEQQAAILRLVDTDPNASKAVQRETQAHTLRETTAESISSADTTKNFATMLRRAGRIDEAEDMDARAKAIRDAVETRAARAGR